MHEPAVIGTGPLAIADVVSIARHGARVEISAEACAAMGASRSHVDTLARSGEPVYGVSTGFGALATKYIDPSLRHQLQRSLIRSHAAGTGPCVETEVVRAMMALRLSTLCTGRCGVRVATAETYASLLNAHITPCVPEYGSLGCSGDLAPLSHCALALMGEGEVFDAEDVRMPAAEALDAAGIQPVELEEKEGLALINGTDGMLGMLALAVTDLHVLVRTADVAAAMSIEALLGTDRVLAADLMALRPHPGQAASARNMARLLEGSEIAASHRAYDNRVQDAYSLRCAPQVAGAVRDTIGHAERVAGFELASTIDNPIVLEDGRIESNGNFHGAPLASAFFICALKLPPLGLPAHQVGLHFPGWRVRLDAGWVSQALIQGWHCSVQRLPGRLRADGGGHVRRL